MPELYFHVGGVIPAAAIISLVFCFVISFFVRRAALFAGIVDIPRDGRRMHKNAVPMGGGLGMIIAFCVCLWLISAASRIGASYAVRLAPLCFFCGIYGLCDDKFALKVSAKLAFQFIAAVLASLLLGNAEVFSFFGREYSLGVLSFPVTVFGFMFMMNAVNLTDGVDGLASGVCAVSAAALCVMHVLRGGIEYAVGSAALCGVCLGFLFHNTAPAKMFMGEAGSAFLGFALAALALPFSKGGNSAPLPQIFLALILPVSEAASSFLRRILSGKSPFSPDKEHMHHILYGNGFSVALVCATLYAFSIICAFCAVVYESHTAIAWAVFTLAVPFIRLMLGKKRI